MIIFEVCKDSLVNKSLKSLWILLVILFLMWHVLHIFIPKTITFLLCIVTIAQFLSLLYYLRQILFLLSLRFSSNYDSNEIFRLEKFIIF